MPNSNSSREIFLSYSRSDKHIVEQIRRQLEIKGLSTWIDEGEIEAGDDIVRRINDGLDQSKAFIALAGERYFINDRFPEAEFNAALYKALTVRAWQIIVVKLVPELKLPPLVASRLYIEHTSAHQTADAIERTIRRAEAWDPQIEQNQLHGNGPIKSSPVSFADISDLDLELAARAYLAEGVAKLRTRRPRHEFEIDLMRGRTLRFEVLEGVLKNANLNLSIRGLIDTMETSYRFITHYQKEIDEGLLGKFHVPTVIQLEIHQTRVDAARLSLREQLQEIAERPIVTVVYPRGEDRLAL